MPDFSGLREQMVLRQIKARGIRDPLILDAFRQVPREEFVSRDHAHLAYEDHPVSIDAGQTISQPYIVALMIEAAGIRPGHRVLEIGSGSGYAAAVISRIASTVIGIERHHDLFAASRDRLARMGYDNVQIFEGDGSLGRSNRAPFDAILVAASGSHVPRPLVEQLAEGGRLVLPVGGPSADQDLVKVTKAADGTISQECLGGVRFVPLIGAEGWRGD